MLWYFRPKKRILNQNPNQLEEEAKLEALCQHRNQGEFFRLEDGGDCR